MSDRKPMNYSTDPHSRYMLKSISRLEIMVGVGNGGLTAASAMNYLHTHPNTLLPRQREALSAYFATIK